MLVPLGMVSLGCDDPPWFPKGFCVWRGCQGQRTPYQVGSYLAPWHKRDHKTPNARKKMQKHTLPPKPPRPVPPKSTCAAGWPVTTANVRAGAQGRQGRFSR